MERLKGRKHLEDLALSRIILKCILKEMWWEYKDWINVAQDRGWWLL
jgi:hypothetical protein